MEHATNEDEHAVDEHAIGEHAIVAAPVAALATANDVQRPARELAVDELAEVRTETNRESTFVMLAMVASMAASLFVAIVEPNLAMGALAFALLSMTGSVVAAHVLYANAAKRHRLSTRSLDDIHRAFTVASAAGGVGEEERARALIANAPRR